MTPPDEPSPPDYYARLDVQPSASSEAIREAYRKKAQETHPDHNPGDPQADERFQKIQEAYRVLRDPERRKEYDEVRSRRGPRALQIAQQAPAGCGGYLWRVLAGVVAVFLFFVLEALGVWDAGPWTISLAVGGAALVAGLITALVAARFPDEATDVSLRLDEQRLTMWADGQIVLRIPWTQTRALRLRGEGWTVELVVEPDVAAGLRPVPPVLTEVTRLTDRAILRLDLSDTDVTRDALLTFFRETEAIPFPPSPNERASASTRESPPQGRP